MQTISTAEEKKSGKQHKLHSTGFICLGADSRGLTGVVSVTRIQGLPFVRHSHLQLQREKQTSKWFKAMTKIN